ncbi:hypothetical protein F8S13_07650 [Chloroflexia bacterium SDU3-3]|nr:hypothetical protein F8S13_07650 [Chloroflexia bacterium SDU3-3]
MPALFRRIKPHMPDILAVLLLIALPLVVFWQIWTPNSNDRVMLGGDILMGAYPTRVFVHRLMEGGALPLWNPYQLAGMPLIGDVQVAPFYLPNYLLDALYRGSDLPYIAFELLTIGHYAIGALLFYGFVRNLGVRPAAAVVGAIAFEFNGFFVGHRGHYNMLAVVVWLPGVLWMLDRAWRAASRRSMGLWSVAAGLILSQMVMAGHPQATLYCAITIVAYATYRAVAVWRTGGQGLWRWLRVPAPLALAGALGGGIAAIALLPAAELLGRSLRSAPSFTFVGQYSLMPRNLVGLLVPEFLGWSTTEYRIYAGILTLVLALVPLLLSGQGRPEKRFFGGAALVAFLTALGGFTIIQGLIYRFVPGFGSIRVSARAFYVANFGLAVLAAIGMDMLLAPLPEPAMRRLRLLARGGAMALALAVGLGLILYVLLMNSYKPVGEEFFFSENLFSRQPSGDTYDMLTQTANAYLLFVLLLGAAVALLWAKVLGRLQGRALAFAATLLMFVDVATFAPYHDTIKADPDKAHFTVRQYATTMLNAPWEIADQQQLIGQLRQVPDGVRVDNTAEVLPDNYSAVWRMPFATGYNILDLQQRFELLSQWPNLPPALRRDLLNVGYVLTADDAAPPEPGATLVLENSQGKLWKRAAQPSYAHFSTSFRVASTSITMNGLLNATGSLDAQPPVSMDKKAALAETLQELWPEARAASLFAIGTTGVHSPVDISVLAGGPVKYSAVVVDGVTVTPQQRGIVLALIDPADGTLLSSGAFDTYLSSQESDRLAAAIDAAPQGTIVALATYDEGIAKLNQVALRAMASAGAAADLEGKVGAAYALIGVKGAPSGSALEKFDPAAAVVVDVGSGAMPATPDTTFSSEIMSYQGDQISLLVQNSARGLLAVSESDFPGWEAYVDGLPTPILRVNGMERGVILPPALPGSPHEVTFVYRPLSARLGGAISLLALAAALGTLLAAAASEAHQLRRFLPRRPVPQPEPVAAD